MIAVAVRPVEHRKPGAELASLRERCMESEWRLKMQRMGGFARVRRYLHIEQTPCICRC